MHPILIAKILACAFFAVLFLQSGFDKVADWKGNLEWLTGHFSKSPFRGIVPLLLGTLTIAEISTGVLSAVAIACLILQTMHMIVVAAMTMACLSLVMLFTGQRIAKDYAGAATIAAYFGVALLGLLISGLPNDVSGVFSFGHVR